VQKTPDGEGHDSWEGSGQRLERAGGESDWPAAGGEFPAPGRDAPSLWVPRQWTPLARALAATGDHWTLVIALQLAPGTMRLTRLRDRLPGVSTGVLNRHLQRMIALGLVFRRRFREMPPRVELELTESGQELLPIAGALTRWGMRHMWSMPQERESIDIGSLLRLLPMLVEETLLPGGSIELAVQSSEHPIRHLFDIREGRLEPLDSVKPPIPHTSIEGGEQAWIAALGPTHDYMKLRFSGDEQLARKILDALPRHS
jgi:DNA-binding HxlR family transcriptional regulator